MWGKRALRIAVAIAFVSVAIVFIARSDFVAAFSDSNLERAEGIWPSHPAVRSARAMLEVAEAAAQGRPLGSNTRASLRGIAQADPLAAEPFLILGAEAQRKGDVERAESLLLNARQRDPRAPAVRYLLAEQYISQGRIRQGLSEAAALGRLVPGSQRPLAAAIARYIESDGPPSGLEAMLRSNPGLTEGILNELANNPSNAKLLLRMAEILPVRDQASAPGWQTRLINKIVVEGDYRWARQVWAKFRGRNSDPSETIHDPRFEGSNAPPPFNWTYAARGAVVEPQPGKLRILYFGRDNVTLASQLLVLQRGRYRFRMEVSGQLADAADVRWMIRCLPDKSIILDRPVKRGTLDLEFDVPAGGCGAQQLTLVGEAVESSSSSDFVVSKLSLTGAEAR